MTIRYLKHNEIDFEKWDYCIDNAFNGFIYGYSWYLDVASHYWDALVKGDYEYIMPLPCRKKFGFDYIYQPAFVQQLGVFSARPVTSELLSEFIGAIPEKFKYVVYNLNIHNNLPQGQNYKILDNQTFELSLAEKYEVIRKGYTTNNKRNIKKADKSNIFITYSSGPEPIINLFRNNRGKVLGTISKTEYNNLKHIAYSALHKGIARVHSAYGPTNTLCAGMIIVKSHDRIIFLFSGSNEEARQTGAMSKLIDDFISNNAPSPYVLDFEGSNHPGTAKFYRSFGSQKRIYQSVVINRMPGIFKLIFYVYKRVKSLILRFN